MTITEVGKRYGLSADTLRYYERVGLIPHVTRTSGGIRNYQEEDCRWVEFIKCMRGAGLPVETLIEYVRLFQQGEKTVESRKTLLMEQRDLLTEKIAEMQQTLDRLNKKIEAYENKIIPIENKLTKTETLSEQK